MESPTPQPAPGSATFMEGCKDSLPIVISYIPVAFAFGLNATRLGFSPLESVFFSCIIYAGASQFVITAMLAAGSSLWVAALTVMAMDVRHVLYGPSLRSRIIQRLQLTEKGHEFLREVLPPQHNCLHQLWSALSTTEKDQLEQITRKLLSRLDQMEQGGVVLEAMS